jgi:hypothetical protein
MPPRAFRPQVILSSARALQRAHNFMESAAHSAFTLGAMEKQ